MIGDIPLFRKLKDDEFYNLVTKFTQIDEISKEQYKNYW